MSEQTISPRPARLLGLDPEITPWLSIGLGLAGLLMRVKPRMAAVPLAFTAATAVLYRDPERQTPCAADCLFAPADAMIDSIDEFYEHRYLHTDAVRVSMTVGALAVPVHRSPADGVVELLERIPASPHSAWDVATGIQPELLTLGLMTVWGPMMLEASASQLGRTLECLVQPGQQVQAGQRLIKARLGSRLNFVLPRDLANAMPAPGKRVVGGRTRLSQIVPW